MISDESHTESTPPAWLYNGWSNSSIRVEPEEDISGGLYVNVIYDERRWRTLWEKREIATRLMTILSRLGIESIIYGSVARGDVHQSSDVEVFIPRPVNPLLIETIIEREAGGWVRREVVQATPSHVPKGYIYLDDYTTVSFPFLDLRRPEWVFYEIAGELGLKEVLRKERTPGMNKELMAIIPTAEGHSEFPAEKEPELAARLIGVDPRDIRGRISILKRRRLHGRTGVFRKIVLADGESFSSVHDKLVEENPWLRRRVRG